MPAVTFIPTLEEAVSYTKRFTWRDNAGVIVDTAGYSADMMIKDVVDGTLILELTDGNGRIVLGIQGTPPDDYNVESQGHDLFPRWSLDIRHFNHAIKMIEV